MSVEEINYIKSLKDGKRRAIVRIAKHHILQEHKEELGAIIKEMEEKVGLRKSD